MNINKVTILLIGSLAAIPAVAESTVSHGNAAMGKMILGLLVVTAMIYGLAWIVKKITQGNLLQNNNMRMISAMALGTKEKVVLIEVENQKILLGVAAGGINALHVFSESSPEERSFEESSETLNKQAVQSTEESTGESTEEATELNSQHENSIESRKAPPFSCVPFTMQRKQDFSSYIQEILKFNTSRKA